MIAAGEAHAPLGGVDAFDALLPEPDRAERIAREREALAARSSPLAAPLPLAGALVAIKDIFHVRGFATRAGSRLPPELLAGEEGPAVAALRAAGAIVLGKAVSTEFAYFGPGPTRNPRHPEHTPGGSSSGSAAAVAAGLCPLALGTQTIGSVIRPAAFCGVVGFKPSYDRISRDGVIPLAPSFDHVGIFAPDVAWATRAAAVLCRDWRDEVKVDDGLPGEGKDGEPERRESRRGSGEQGRGGGEPREEGGGHRGERGERERGIRRFGIPRLGIPRGPYLDSAAEEGRAHFRAVVARLEAAGFDLCEVALFDDFLEMAERHLRIVAAEAARVHAEWYAAHSALYHPKTVELIERGQAISDADLARDLAASREVRGAIAAAAAAAGIDFWIAPPALGSAPRGLASTGDPVLNVPWSQAGVPALALPAGTNAEGLPLGLQVAGSFGGDEELLAAGSEIERALAGWNAP